MDTAPALRPPRILAIAGSDSSGGAGIQADIKTITMLSGYAMTAVTSVTAQNSVGVQAIAPMSGEIVYSQIRSCIEDIGYDAIKIGMLHDEEIIDAVTQAIHDCEGDIILDPVMISTSGAQLIAPEAVTALREKLFPIVTVITPNLPELSHLVGRTLSNTQEMLDAASELAQRSFSDIVAKGGHMDDERIVDLLVNFKGDLIEQFEHQRIDTPHTHGTGCTLSSAIATLMAHGQPLHRAVPLARNFVVRAIAAAPGYGKGNGPLGHQAVRRISD